MDTPKEDPSERYKREAEELRHAVSTLNTFAARRDWGKPYLYQVSMEAQPPFEIRCYIPEIRKDLIESGMTMKEAKRTAALAMLKILQAGDFTEHIKPSPRPSCDTFTTPKEFLQKNREKHAKLAKLTHEKTAIEMYKDLAKDKKIWDLMLKITDEDPKDWCETKLFDLDDEELEEFLEKFGKLGDFEVHTNTVQHMEKFVAKCTLEDEDGIVFFSWYGRHEKPQEARKRCYAFALAEFFNNIVLHRK